MTSQIALDKRDYLNVAQYSGEQNATFRKAGIIGNRLLHDEKRASQMLNLIPTHAAMELTGDST